MCRWIAYVGTEPILITDLIERPSHSLLKQVHIHDLPGIDAPPADEGYGAWNALLNADGWGIGWYSTAQSKYRTHDTRDPHTGKIHRVNLPPHMPTVQRSMLPPMHDLNLRSLARTIESEVVFGHIRATVGSPVALPNCHPFNFGRYLFMHNGSVGGFFDAQDKIRQHLSREAREKIEGTTDTETVAALFFTFLEAHGPWLRSHSIGALTSALRSTVALLIELCTPPSGHWLDEMGNPTRWISLNLAITDGEKFVALRYAYPPKREAPSLYWSRVAGSAFDRRFRTHPDGGHDIGELHRKTHAPHLIVASEPMTSQHNEWTLMKNGEIIAYDRSDPTVNHISLRLGFHDHGLPEKGSTLPSHLPNAWAGSETQHPFRPSHPGTHSPVNHHSHPDAVHSDSDSEVSVSRSEGGVALRHGSWTAPELRQTHANWR